MTEKKEKEERNKMSSEYQSYQDAARERYSRHVLAQEKEREKREKEESEKREKEEKIERDHSFIYEKFEEWDQCVTEMKKKDVLHIFDILDLHLLYSMVDEESPWMKLMDQYDRMDELQERVVSLVHFLNEVFNENRGKERKEDREQIREIYSIMKEMIEKTGSDIPIEMMDTERDEEISRQLQEQEDQEMIRMMQERMPGMIGMPSVVPRHEEYYPIQEEKKEEMNDIPPPELPIVSLTSTRVGLRLPTLKALAKSHGLSCSGTKRELAIMLESKRLVRIVDEVD